MFFCVVVLIYLCSYRFVIVFWLCCFQCASFAELCPVVHYAVCCCLIWVTRLLLFGLRVDGCVMLCWTVCCFDIDETFVFVWLRFVCP